MLQLRPGELFTIAYQIADPGDSNTYYVRSVVRDAQSDVVLQTINLTDKGSQRFRGSYSVPQDSGLGFFITITTTVYTNSGYTTPASYEIQEETYLVQERITRSLMGGGGCSLTPEQIRKALRDVLKALPEKEQKELDLSPILEAIEINRPKDVEIPDNSTDFKKLSVEVKRVEGILESWTRMMRSDVQDLGGKVSGIKIPEQKDADFSQVLEAIGKLNIDEEKVEKINSNIEAIRAFFTKDIDELKELVADLSKRMEKMRYLVVDNQKESDED